MRGERLIERTVAEIHHALGSRTAWIAYVAADMAEAAAPRDEAEDLAERIADVVRDVPRREDMSRSTKHNEFCYQRHAQCLADKIIGELGDYPCALD